MTTVNATANDQTAKSRLRNHFSLAKLRDRGDEGSTGKDLAVALGIFASLGALGGFTGHEIGMLMRTTTAQQVQAQATQTVQRNVDPGVLTQESQHNLSLTFKDNATDGKKLIVSVQCQDSATQQQQQENYPNQNIHCKVAGVRQVASFG